MTNWGILGLGRMGTTFAEAINEVSGSKLISIASKSGKIFKKFENKSYDYVINNENIDSVYIATLNNSHIDLIYKLCDAKKNILCEKPVSISFNELSKVKKKLLEKDIKLYEAIAYYSHPQTIELLKPIVKKNYNQIIWI